MSTVYPVAACVTGVEDVLDWLATDWVVNRDTTVVPLLDQNGVDLRPALRAHYRPCPGILTQFAVHVLWLHEGAVSGLERKTTDPPVSFNCR